MECFCRDQHTSAIFHETAIYFVKRVHRCEGGTLYKHDESPHNCQDEPYKHDESPYNRQDEPYNHDESPHNRQDHAMLTIGTPL